jgi:hypothetical protein
LDASGNGSITTSDIDNGSNDACGIASMSLDQTSFDCSNVGANTVTLTVTDNNGNVSTCSTTVTVQDNTAPTAVCQNATVVLDASGNGSITTSDIDNGSNDACGIASMSLDQTSFDCSNVGANTVTLTVTDNNGNVSTCSATVTVQDNTAPTVPNLPVISAECSVTVPVPTVSDNCLGTITGTTSDPLTYTTQGSFAITWDFDDGNGNSINVVQNVVVDDVTDPTAICQDITVQLDDTTGLATITSTQIDNGSNDNCGVVNLSLSQSTFDCTDIGTNIIVLTVDDGNGNSSTCSASVTVTSPTITGGTLIGHLVDGSGDPINTNPDSNIIEVTACPDEPQYALLNLSGYTGTISGYEVSTDGGLSWSSPSNDSTNATYTSLAITETTLVRAVIAFGSCEARSNIVYLAVIPPDIPPTIVSHSDLTICLGSDITVVAQSEFGINPDLTEGGLFNTSNLNNLGWLVDGMATWDASGNTGNDTYWKGTNGPKNFNNKCYDSPEGNKFGIASGIPPYDSPNHTITPLTTLETPIFNTLGLTTATLEFDQAYFLEAGAWVKIELSLNDGATYPITLDPGPSYNYTGPSSTTFGNVGFGGGGPNGCNGRPQTYVDNHVSIDLQDYIGLVGLRIKFTYHGTANSAWALENITIPQAPIDEVIEWTDESGVVVTTGSTTTITPVTPGVQTYGVTSLINGCRSDGDEGTEFISVNASLAYAGEDITQIVAECGEEVSLNAYDNTITAADNIVNGVNNPAIFTSGTYPGTGVAGVWSAVSISGCGSSYSFSDISSPRSKFFAEPGTYELTWTIPSVGCSDVMLVTIESCPTVDFDGIDDHVTFSNNYNLSNQFSLEVWVKPESVVGTQAIFSKRDANDLSTGYDLSLNNSIVQFNWNASGTIQSSYPISTDRWYHIAVTNNNGSYRMYIDGIEVSTAVSGASPSSNSMKSLVGAMDQANNAPNRPVNYFNGWIDELRIWNSALTVDQIRQMMNQEIEDNTAVIGAVVPLDIPGLNWTDLDGYYRMDSNCGFLIPYKGIRGQLINMDTAQPNTAPLPYTSRVDGQLWSTDNTWTEFDVWDAPNSIGVDGVTPIDWNIVETSHNIDSGNKDITVLGLLSIVPNKTLNITDPGTSQDEYNDGQFLRVTHYLKLDGNIDLFGESQLLQDEGSILDVTSSGQLERDQQGTTNLYNYNYWTSPVSELSTTSNNNPFAINSVLRDGTNSNTPLSLLWTTANDAIGSTTPITLSSRWLYAYENYPEDTYAAWRDLSENDVLATGLAFTMKGSGAGDPVNDVQNYVFVGKPNNGTITTPVTIGNQALIGNPYPSAIDANAFIFDNIPGGNPGTSQSIDGTLYFWEHYVSNFTHVLEDYEGGYATYNLTGGNPAVSPPLVSGSGTPTKIPGQYIPVSQGFFVTASHLGGTIQFKNSQRVFVRETSANSQFIRSSNSNAGTSYQVDSDPNQDIKRVRIEFKTTDGNIRPLLLGFVPNNMATDGIDVAYDAENADAEFSNDLFWRIEDRNFTTQGVGDFDVNSQYPLAMFINTFGTYEISLKALENFETAIDVYVYDALMGTYFEINDEAFQILLDPNDYLGRFYITFTTESSLSIDDEVFAKTIINYLNNTQEIYIKTPNVSAIKNVQLINMIGQEIQNWDNIQAFELNGAVRIPVTNIPDGSYIIKVSSDKTTNSVKAIVKNN